MTFLKHVCKCFELVPNRLALFSFSEWTVRLAGSQPLCMA